MRIKINKDIEKEYKNEFAQGFTAVECLFIAAALLELIGVTILLYIYTDLSVNLCAYAGLPVAVPTLFLGFKKFDGMSCGRYLKELLWERKTKILTFEAEEAIEDTRVFTMEGSGILGRQKGRRKRT